jgi:hypothetical protein
VNTRKMSNDEVKRQIANNQWISLIFTLLAAINPVPGGF